MGIRGSLCHSFNYINMRFVVELTFFPIKFYKKICFRRKFLRQFCYFFFTRTYYPLDE